MGLDCCPIISIRFFPICVTAVIIFRTTLPLSTFPFIPILPKRDAPYCGESASSKRSWTQEKKLSLRYANPQKKRKRSTPGITFLPESAGSGFLSRFVLTGIVWNFTLLIDSPSKPILPIPFFEKAKYRNLEVSRPCSGLNPKFKILGRPILILNSGLIADQKMVTASGSMGSKSKPNRDFVLFIL